MKPILFAMILLVLPVSAYADWSNTGMNPVQGPNFIPNQVQAARHEVRVNAAPQGRIEPQHHTQPAVAVRHEQPVNQKQVTQRHEPVAPGYFRRDADYYGHSRAGFIYSDVDTNFTVPEALEAVIVDGQAYYYNEGVFYQQIAGQLTAIPPVLGAVVDSIPQDYQIVMADGVHYLFTGGVFYQRVDQGFEVVEPPVSDQE